MSNESPPGQLQRELGLDQSADADSLLKALARAIEESRQLREAAEKMPAADEFPVVIQQPIEPEPDLDLLLLEDSPPPPTEAQS